MQQLVMAAICVSTSPLYLVNPFLLPSLYPFHISISFPPPSRISFQFPYLPVISSFPSFILSVPSSPSPLLLICPPNSFHLLSSPLSFSPHFSFFYYFPTTFLHPETCRYRTTTKSMLRYSNFHKVPLK
jgi:hypothetical protein